MSKEIVVKRGDVYLANLGERNGSVQAGIRPVLIYSNDWGNSKSPVLFVIPFTGQVEKCINSKTGKLRLPVHALVEGKVVGLDKDSVALTEQARVIDRSQLLTPKIAHLDEVTMKRIDQAFMIANGLIELPQVRAKHSKELAHA